MTNDVEPFGRRYRVDLPEGGYLGFSVMANVSRRAVFDAVVQSQTRIQHGHGVETTFKYEFENHLRARLYRLQFRIRARLKSLSKIAWSYTFGRRAVNARLGQYERAFKEALRREEAS